MNILKSILIIFIFTFIVSCKPTDYTLEFSEDEIEEHLSKNFPLNKDLFIAKLSLKNPQLSFINDGISIDLDYNGTLLADTLTGIIKVDGGLNYQKQDNSFYLKNASIQNLTINELKTSETENIKSTLEQVIIPYLEKFPVYKLQGGKLDQTLLKSSLKEIKIKEKKLILVLGV